MKTSKKKAPSRRQMSNLETLPIELLERIVKLLDNESKSNLIQVSKYFYKNKNLCLPMFPNLSIEHELIHGTTVCEKFAEQRPGFLSFHQSEETVFMHNRKTIENCFFSPFGPLVTLTYLEGGAEMFSLSGDDFVCHRPCLFTTEKKVLYVTYSPPMQDVFMGAFVKTEFGFFLVDVDRTEYVPCVYYILVNIFGVMEVTFCLTNFLSATVFFMPATYGFYRFKATIGMDKHLELEIRQLNFQKNRTKPMYVFFFCEQVGWVATDGIYMNFKRIFKFSTPVKFDDRGYPLAKAQKKIVNVLHDESHLFIHIDKWEKNSHDEYNLEWIYIFDLMRKTYKFKIERENCNNMFFQTSRYYFTFMKSELKVCRHDILDGDRNYLKVKEQPVYIAANHSHLLIVSKTTIRCYELHPQRKKDHLSVIGYNKIHLDKSFGDFGGSATFFLRPA